jgi:NAD(P)-dependent dehydrogenase (short-subunit alcohol dehydrogenase family)
MARMNGKAALVTGGTTGLGAAIAERYLVEGAEVVITGRDEAVGRAAEERLSALGRVRFLRADAADAADVQRSVDDAVAFLGGLDVLVNNAGIGLQATVLGTPIADFDRLIAVNVRGPYLYALAAFPHLEARGGCMIHNASDAGVLGEVEIGVYSVTKAAVLMLSNMLAIEAGPRGVRSNAICPGDIRPGMRHNGPPGDPDRVDDDEDEWLRPPVGRRGEAADIAAACVYLASDDASFVTGTALLVDGGMRAGAATGTPPGPAERAG